MHLGGAGLAQQPDNLPAGGAPYDGIIHQHHPLAPNHRRQGVQLDVNAGFPGIGLGLMKVRPMYLLLMNPRP